MKVVEERSALYAYIEETLTVLIQSSDVSNGQRLQTSLDERTAPCATTESLTGKQTERQQTDRSYFQIIKIPTTSTNLVPKNYGF